MVHMRVKRRRDMHLTGIRTVVYCTIVEVYARGSAHLRGHIALGLGQQISYIRCRVNRSWTERTKKEKINKVKKKTNKTVDLYFY